MDDIRPEGADKAEQPQFRDGHPGKLAQALALERDDLDRDARGAEPVVQRSRAGQDRENRMTSRVRPVTWS